MVITVHLTEPATRLAGQRDLRRVARDFTARRGVPIMLRRAGLTRWTLTYPVGPGRIVEISANTAMTRSFLQDLTESTDRGDRPEIACVRSALTQLLTAAPHSRCGPTR